MALIARRNSQNPHLGVYFGIFTSLVVALVLVVLLLDQLGGNRHLLSWLMLAVPLLLYAAIGIAGRSEEVIDFHACGRRVPAVYNGALLAVTAIGGTGIVSLTGSYFLHGFDAWCLGSGLVAGFVVMGVLIAPFVRKFGGFTLAGYIGRRFDSHALRVLSAVLMSVPMLLVLSAELATATIAAVVLTGLEPRLAAVLIAAALIATLVLGGVRSFTWSATAQAITAVLAIVVPSTLLALLAGNLPLPQLSHGPTMRAIGRAETLQGVPIPIPSPLTFDLAGVELFSVAQRIAHPFGSIGPLAYVLASLVVMAGIAAAPWLVTRAVTTPSVYQSRKSHGWATLIAGVMLLTLSANAVFLRDFVMDTLVGRDPAALPQWFRSLVATGQAAVDTMSSRVPLQAISIKRDAVLIALPIAAGFPVALLDAVLAGVIAAALAGSAAVAVALAATIAEDVLARPGHAPGRNRLAMARVSLVAVVVAGGVISLTATPDPLRHLLWALAITAATAFPVMVLSIWWKRINTPAAGLAMAVGFTVTILTILAGEAGLTPFKSVLAGFIGLSVSFATGLMVAPLTAPPRKQVLELVHDLRVPGGETIHDRDERHERLRQRHTSS